MHIGVITEGFVGWGGGIGFIENLLVGLAAVPDKVTKVTVFVPTHRRTIVRRFASRVKRAALQPSQAMWHLGGASQERGPWQRAVDQFTNITPNVVEYDGSRVSLLRLCKNVRVDVLLPLIAPLKRSDIQWVGYLFDCQHKYYPEFFSGGEIAARDKAFESMLYEADVVIVNAKSVVADLEKFFPKKKAKLFSLPFSPLIRAGHLSEVMSRTQSAKNNFLTGNYYFIISNQFWIHKDHRTAFQAFAQVAHEPALREFKLVCTGLTEDYRFPGYFDELKLHLKNLGIQNRVIFTGYIDKLEQLALLNGAVALVQPTLFEGGPGGGAAFDALALGIPCLLSDIPVNLEINDPLVSFFKTRHVESLAKEMEHAATYCWSRQEVDMLIERSRQYARGLGLKLYEVANATYV
jgi:glycosyltransferase involved in cell wall biosynthesis